MELSTSQAALPAWIDRLFLRMATMYGNLWAQRWEGIPMQAVQAQWAAALEGRDLLVIKRALDYCQQYKPYPPTLPEFLQAMTDSRPAAAHQPVRDVPRIAFDSTDALKAVQQVSAKMVRPRDDPHYWAKTIIAEHAAGTYKNEYGLRCAREVLGIKREATA